MAISQTITPATARYIKLGEANAWADRCLTAGELEFGRRREVHAPALAGDWDAVRTLLIQEGGDPRHVGNSVREIRDFYELGSDTLWVTLHRGRLWWAFAEAQVLGAREEAGGAGVRRVIGAWRDESVQGELLEVADLSSAITKTASYQRTICRIAAETELLRRINGEHSPAAQEVEAAQRRLSQSVLPLVQLLDQDDFEVLVDLIFAAQGWRRVGALGGRQKDVDLVVQHPATGERAYVQVKSAADAATFVSSAHVLDAYPAPSRLVFVTHSPRGELAPATGSRVELWSGDALTDRILDAGLVGWVLKKGG